MSTLPSDVVEDCASNEALGHDEMKKREYYKFNPKFNCLGLSSNTDSGFGSVEGCTRSLRDELEPELLDREKSNESVATLTDGLDRLNFEDNTPAIVERDVRSETDLQLHTSSSLRICGVDPYVQNEDGDTDLHLAIIHSREDVADVIIKGTPSAEYFVIYNNLIQTPLHLAAFLGQHTVCRKLVIAGALVDARDRHGQTPLHMACENGDLETVKALTTPPNQQESQQMQCRGVISNLPQDLELKNYEGLTCVHLAALGDHIHVLDYLVHIGADINVGDGKSGRTALHYAVEEQNTELVKLLLSAWRAYVDPVTYNLCTPLHLAVGRGYHEVTEVLMQAGADIAFCNVEKETPYDLAAYQSSVLPLLETCTYDDLKVNGQPVSL